MSSFKGCFFLFILFLSLVSAQTGIDKQIEGATENLEKNVTAIREFVERDKLQFLGSQWKEFLLKNKFISGMDSFFTNINLVFVILFGMDWSLSLNMFFAFLFWSVIFYSMLKFKIFSRNKLFRWIYFISVMILLPMTQIYEYVSSLLVHLVFYKESNSWRAISLITFICIFLVLGILFSNLGSWYKKRLENKAKKRESENREELEKVVKATRS